MRYRIHYTIKGVKDYFELSGDSIEDIRQAAHDELSRRGLTESDVLYSELLD